MESKALDLLVLGVYSTKVEQIMNMAEHSHISIRGPLESVIILPTKMETLGVLHPVS